MRQSYLEMHGAGNRIVVIDRRSASTPAAAADALSALTAGGVKFDQLMWLEAAEDPAHAGRYRVFNVDGSEVEQCGNGARCLVRAISGRGGLSGRSRRFCRNRLIALEQRPVGPADRACPAVR